MQLRVEHGLAVGTENARVELVKLSKGSGGGQFQGVQEPCDSDREVDVIHGPRAHAGHVPTILSEDVVLGSEALHVGSEDEEAAVGASRQRQVEDLRVWVLQLGYQFRVHDGLPSLADQLLHHQRLLLRQFPYSRSAALQCLLEVSGRYSLFYIGVDEVANGFEFEDAVGWGDG